MAFECLQLPSIVICYCISPAPAILSKVADSVMMCRFSSLR